MYRKYDVSHCNQNEITKLNKFKKDNPDKGWPTVYFTTEGFLGMGFRLIATFDKPKRKNGKIDFGDCVDITDYDYRLDQY